MFGTKAITSNFVVDSYSLIKHKWYTTIIVVFFGVRANMSVNRYFSSLVLPRFYVLPLPAFVSQVVGTVGLHVHVS